jgi:hypothetical protein
MYQLQIGKQKSILPNINTFFPKFCKTQKRGVSFFFFLGAVAFFFVVKFKTSIIFRVTFYFF